MTTHDPLTCELCHDEGMDAEIAAVEADRDRYKKALEHIHAYFVCGWPDDEDVANIRRIARRELLP